MKRLILTYCILPTVYHVELVFYPTGAKCLPRKMIYLFYCGLLIIAYCLLPTANCLAQDLHFSQFYAAPLYSCPSFSGTTDGSRAVLNYRNQWPEIPGAFISYAFSLDHYFKNMKSGVGLLFVRDQAGKGKLSTTNIGLQYSYNITINRFWQVRPGVHFLYSQRSVDYNRNTFGDELLTGQVSFEQISMPKLGYTDFASSVLAYSKKYWFGATVDHLMKPNQSFMELDSRIPIKYTFFGGTKHRLKGSLGRRYFKGRTSGKYRKESITFAFLYKFQENFSQLDLGGYWYKRPIVIGVWYRGLLVSKEYKGYGNSDAAIFLVGYKVDNLSIGYSYDFNISKLITSTGGAHELSLIYEFNQSQEAKKKYEIVPCPKF